MMDYKIYSKASKGWWRNAADGGGLTGSSESASDYAESYVIALAIHYNSFTEQGEPRVTFIPSNNDEREAE